MKTSTKPSTDPVFQDIADTVERIRNQPAKKIATVQTYCGIPIKTSRFIQRGEMYYIDASMQFGITRETVIYHHPDDHPSLTDYERLLARVNRGEIVLGLTMIDLLQR